MSAVQCGQAETFFDIMSAMKPKILTGAATAVFTVLAGVGVVAGREWRLLLVPLGMLPLLRMIGAAFSAPASSAPEGSADAYSTALGDCTHVGLASILTDVIARNLGCGRCVWAPGAMTAAMTAAAALPQLSGKVVYPALRIVCLLAAAAYFAFAPFVFPQELDMGPFGSVLTMFVYVPTRHCLAYSKLTGRRAEA